MCHARGVLDEALDAAEALRQLPDRGAADQLHRFLLGGGEEGDHPAEVAHLPGGDLVPWMRGEPRVENLLDRLVRVQERGDAARVLAVLAHADGERLDPAQNEPGVEWAGDRSQRLLQAVQALGDRRVVRRDEAAYDVRMAAEVLGRGVERDV